MPGLAVQRPQRIWRPQEKQQSIRVRSAGCAWACPWREIDGRCLALVQCRTLADAGPGLLHLRDKPVRLAHPPAAPGSGGQKRPLPPGRCAAGPIRRQARLHHTAESAAGADLLAFVKNEFDAILECGSLAHGLLPLRCDDCGHDKWVAFSCKRRGFCPSCWGRRLAWTAAHRVVPVIPHLPVRQWGLVAVDSALAVAGRAIQAGDARAAGCAPRHHVQPARAGRAQSQRGPQRSRHADPALGLSGQSQYRP